MDAIWFREEYLLARMVFFCSKLRREVDKFVGNLGWFSLLSFPREMAWGGPEFLVVAPPQKRDGGRTGLRASSRKDSAWRRLMGEQCRTVGKKGAGRRGGFGSWKSD